MSNVAEFSWKWVIRIVSKLRKRKKNSHVSWIGKFFNAMNQTEVWRTRKITVIRNHDGLRPQKKFFLILYITCLCLSGYNQWTLFYLSVSGFSLAGAKKRGLGGGRKARKRGNGTYISLNILSIWRWFLLRRLRRGAKCWDYESVAKCWDGECQIYSLTGKCPRRHKEKKFNLHSSKRVLEIIPV